MRIHIVDKELKPVRTIKFAAAEPHKKTGGLDLFTAEKTQDVLLSILPTDNIKILKEKIFLATNYYPCEQLLYTGGGHAGTVGFTTYYDGIALGIDSLGKTFEEKDLLYVENREHEKIAESEYYLLPLEEVCPDSIEVFLQSTFAFYPYFDYSAMSTYKAQNYQQYPSLFPLKNVILKRATQDEKRYEDIRQFRRSNLRKYNIRLLDDINEKNTLVNFAIKTATYIYQQRGYCDLENLFSIFATSENCPVAVYQNYTTFTKVFGGTKYTAIEKFARSARGSVYVGIYTKNIFFEIDAAGTILAHVVLDKNLNNFKELENIYKAEIKHLSRDLAKLPFSVFGDGASTPNSIEKIVIQLDIAISVENHEAFVKRLAEVGIGDSWEYSLKASVSPPHWNEFKYLTDAEYSIDYGNSLHITNNYSDFRVEMRGITKTEFYEIYLLLIYMLAQEKTVVIERSNANLKLLKQIDPKSFSVQVRGKAYSRICQKDKQPQYIESAKGLPSARVLEFWNYTKGEPMLFYCPNDDYPYPGFITDWHPEGYCTVCCRKKKKILGNYKITYDKCRETHFVHKNIEKQSTRYIINYGKELSNGRLGDLPPIVNKFLVYNLPDINIISSSVTVRSKKFNNNIYSLDKLFKVTRLTKAIELPVEDLKQFLYVPTWKIKRKKEKLIRPIDVLLNPAKNRKYAKHYKRILNADLSYAIIMYRDEDNYVIIDGLHRLAKAVLEKRKNISAKIISRKQLDRSLTQKYTPEEDTFIEEVKVGAGALPDKLPSYYIVGIQQTIGETNISFVSSFAYACGYSLSSFMSLTIKNLEEVETVDIYKSSHLIELLQGGGDRRYNEIFAKVLPLLHEKKLIIFDDVFGDSSVINLVYMTGESFDDDEYVILLKTKGIYYPITIVIPYEFFKTGEIEKRIYNPDDKIITVIKMFFETNEISNKITFEKIQTLAKPIRIFSEAGYIYAVEIKYKGKLIYVAFPKKTDTGVVSGHQPLEKYDFAALLAFYAEYGKKFGIERFIIDKFYTHAGNCYAVRIEEQLHFTNFKFADLHKYARDEFQFIADEAPVRYPPEKILRLKHTRPDPIFDDYLRLREARNNYTYFKEKIFAELRKGATIDKLAKKYAKDIHMAAFMQEWNNPLKNMLFQRGVYNFSKIYMQKHANETLYIREPEDD